MDSDIKVKRVIFINNCTSMNNEFCFIKPEEQVKLLNLYNAHFTGSPSWSFKSDMFSQLMNSWNVNLRVIFDLPYGTHSYQVNSLTEGKHAREMIYQRYLKFLKSVATNRRPALVSLLKEVQNSCLALVGNNLRRILLDSGVQVNPGVTMRHELAKYTVYETPAEEGWRLGLLTGLLEVRDSRWTIQFDEEFCQYREDEITAMISNALVRRDCG